MNIREIKTASDVKYHLEPSSHFFSRDTMRFFGDTMSNYGVLVGLFALTDHSGNVQNVPAVRLFRKRAVKHGGLKSSTMFMIEGDYLTVWHGANDDYLGKLPKIEAAK